MTTYAGRQRATALAVWGTIASMGIAAGVLFGGLLTSVLDWRAVFFINVPIGIVTLLGVLHVVPRGVTTSAGGQQAHDHQGSDSGTQAHARHAHTKPATCHPLVENCPLAS